MAACSNGAGMRRRWFVTLSLVAALGTLALGALVWQAVELSSLTAVSARVEQAKPMLSALRLATIGVLAVLWPQLARRLSSLLLRTSADDESTRTRWMALRWRVVGWLLVIELIIGQNLFGRFFHLAVHSS
jgi:hypothetical protein